MTEILRLMCVLAHRTASPWALAVYWRSMPPRGVEAYLVTATRGERGWLGSKEE